jgi:hypothetical protein
MQYGMDIQKNLVLKELDNILGSNLLNLTSAEKNRLVY